MRALISLALALPALLIAAPADATAGQPTLSVSVSDGVETASSGDDLHYTVTIVNEGGEAFSGSLRIRMPDFVELTGSGGDIDAEGAVWQVDVPAGATVEFEAQAAVKEAPADAYQIVALAEVSAADGAVIVRAADADSVPGAAAPPPVPGLTDEGDESPSWLPVVAIGAGAVALGAAVAVVAVTRRSRRSQDGPGD